MANAKCLVVYGSKYGSTREVAEAIADGLGADIAPANSHPDVREYDLIVVGSPIYGGDYVPALKSFIRANYVELSRKKIAAFITAAASFIPEAGLTGEEDEAIWTQQHYADGLARMTGGDVIADRGFGGRLIPSQLDKHDRATLEWFYQFLMHKPLEGFDLLDAAEAYRWGESLRDIMGG